MSAFYKPQLIFNQQKNLLCEAVWKKMGLVNEDAPLRDDENIKTRQVRVVVHCGGLLECFRV